MYSKFACLIVCRRYNATNSHSNYYRFTFSLGVIALGNGGKDCIHIYVQDRGRRHIASVLSLVRQLSYAARKSQAPVALIEIPGAPVRRVIPRTSSRDDEYRVLA